MSGKVRLPTEQDFQATFNETDASSMPRVRRIVDAARLARELVPLVGRYFQLNHDRKIAHDEGDIERFMKCTTDQWPVFQKICELLAQVDDEGVEG